MKRRSPSSGANRTHVLVPADALDGLLECIWEWAFADFRATPTKEREEHFFQHIVRLDSALHNITVEESWERIDAWWNDQQHK